MSRLAIFRERESRSITLLTLLILVMALMAAPAVAEDHVPVTYYVSPDGNDANDGLTESRPLKDLASAMYRMGLGDTLIVLPGDYDLVNFRTWCKDPWKNKMYLGKDGGSPTIRTTIRGKAGAARPKIRTMNDTGGVGGIQFNGAVGITLEYLDIHGGVGYGRHMIYRDCVIGGEGVVYGVGAEHHDSLIEGNVFHDIREGSDAIGIYIHGHNNVIRRNFFKNIGQHGINSNATGTGSAYGPSRGWIIEQNTITQTDGHGIGLQNVEDFIIRNNVLVNVGSQAISFGGSKYPDRNMHVYNNTIYNYRSKGYCGLFFINDVEGLVVENNLVIHSRPVTFLHPETQLVSSKMATYTFRNNLYYNPSGDLNKIFLEGDSVNGVGIDQWRAYTAGVMGSGAGLETGSLYADPLVVSPPTSGSDYLLADGSSHIDVRLSAASPAIDAGIGGQGLIEDADGRVRPQGAGYDIGAYEFTSGVVPAAPGVPESLNVTGATETTATLEWTAPAGGGISYGIYREGILVAKSSGNSFMDQGLTAATTYKYQVSAFDGEGRESALSASVSVTTALPALPFPPTGLKMTTTTTTVNLRWTAPAGGCVAYGVYRNGIQVAKPTGTDFTDQELVAGTVYEYQVSAFDMYGRESALSASVSATTALPALPSPPTALKVTATTTTTVKLRWTAPTGGCVAYGVYRNGVQVAKPTGTDLTDQDLAAGTTYTYQVSAFDTYDRESALSASVSATTATVPTPPSPTTGRTVYISPDGNDANDGLSEDTPLKDLAKAIYGMGLGDTLIVLPGDYEVVDFRAWCKDSPKSKMYLGKDGGSPDIRTTIKGKAGAPRPRVRALKANGTIGNFQFERAVGITFEHLEIQGQMGYGRYMVYRDCVFGGEGVSSAIFSEHHYALIENCLFQGGTGSAVYLHGHYNTIRNNRFEGNWGNAVMSSATGDGASKGWVIENNVISAVKGNGFRLINTVDTDIRNNVLVNVGGNAICLEGGAFPGKDITIQNNTIANGPKRGGQGLFIVNDVTGLALVNNLILHRRPVYFLNATARLTAEKLGGYDFRHNLYHNPYYAGAPVFWRGMGFNDRLNLQEWQDATAEVSGGTGLDAGSIQADPWLVNPPVTGLEDVGTNGVDPRLSSSSPAIDAGCADAPATDADGHERPQGSGVDIGAYEFVKGEAI